MPQVRIQDDVYDYFREKADREGRTIGAQINRDLNSFIANDEEDERDSGA